MWKVRNTVRLPACGAKEHTANSNQKSVSPTYPAKLKALCCGVNVIPTIVKKYPRARPIAALWGQMQTEIE